MNKIVIYPGRFQPMLSHHAEVFKQLQSQFPDAEVYIGTSDKVEPPKSPFNFKEKQQIAAAHGVPADRVLAANRPYHQEDYAKYFDPASTIIIFAVGEKDMDRFPFNNTDPKTGLDMTVRGEIRPKYYQKINTLKADIKPMSERGYITLAPTIKIGDQVASASAFRDALKAAPDAESAKQIYTKQFGTYNDNVFNLIYNKIARADMSEQINIMRQLAGLPLDEAAPVVFNSADAKTAKFLPPNASSAKMSIANRFPKGSDVNDLAVKKEQFLQALLRSPASLLSEISERLDPKDENSLAVDQKVSDIIHQMNQQNVNVTGLPEDLKQFVLDLTVNAVKNMELSAGDNSPAYDDMDNKDDFEKESIDLSNIRRDYGVEEADLEEARGKIVLRGKPAPHPSGLSKAMRDHHRDLMWHALDKAGLRAHSEHHGYVHDNGDFVVLDRGRGNLPARLKKGTYPETPEAAKKSKFFEEAVRDDNKESLFMNAVQDIVAQAEYAGAYGDVDDESVERAYSYFQRGNASAAAEEILSNFSDQDGGEVDALQDVYNDAVAELKSIMNNSVNEEGEVASIRDVDQVLAKAGSGELDIFDVMSTPKNPEEAAAASIIQNMFDDVSAEQDIDPDDGFDQILSIVKDQLADTYNDSTLEAVNPYAVGMASAMKSTGDKPPLSKKTIRKAHKIAKSVAHNEAVQETSANALEAAMFELRKLAGLR